MELKQHAQLVRRARRKIKRTASNNEAIFNAYHADPTDGQGRPPGVSASDRRWTNRQSPTQRALIERYEDADSESMDKLDASRGFRRDRAQRRLRRFTGTAL